MYDVLILILSLVINIASISLLLADALLVKARWDVRKYGFKYLVLPLIVSALFFLFAVNVWCLLALIQLAFGGLLFLIFWNTDYMIGNNPQLTFDSWYSCYLHYPEKTQLLLARIYRHSSHVFGLEDLLKLVKGNVDGKKIAEDKDLLKIFTKIESMIKDEAEKKKKIFNVEYLYFIDYQDVNVLRPFKRIIYIYREKDQFKKLEGTCIEIPYEIKEYGINFKNILMLQGPKNETISQFADDNVEILSVTAYLPSVKDLKNTQNKLLLAKNQVTYLQKAYNEAVATNNLVVSSVEGDQFEIKSQVSVMRKEFYIIISVLMGIITLFGFLIIMLSLGVF